MILDQVLGMDRKHEHSILQFVTEVLTYGQQGLPDRCAILIQKHLKRGNTHPASVMDS